MTMVSEPKLFSHHVFIFPFRWDISPGNGKSRMALFASRTDLQVIRRKMEGGVPARTKIIHLKWERHTFDWPRDYNEAVYFHPFVREVLFDKGGNESNIGLQYHISGKDKYLKYNIALAGEQEHPSYQLDIEELTLNFYETGIGFLGFHLNNRSHGSPEEILQINDFGRRIFPQFLGEQDADNRLAVPKGAFLAEKIELISGDTVFAGDDFSGLLQNAAKTADASGWLIPGFIRGLLPAFLHMGKILPPQGDVEISPLLDDRMFVVCWFGNDDWSKALTIKRTDRPHETNEQWHRLIFVDGKSPGMANTDLLRQLNIAHTNTRWQGEGTFFGASRYSFVALTNAGGFGRNVILRHIQSMYFQITLLCLLQRGSIVRFSEEIARLAKDDRKDRDKEAEVLYRKYLHFINKIYFREVTPQEQGIELYKLLQDKMEIERDVKNLQVEIQDFFNLLKLQSDERQTHALNTLTVVGSGLLAPGLILAYFGISQFPEIADKWNFIFWSSITTSTGSLTAIATALAWVLGRKWVTVLFLACTIAVFLWAINLPFIFSK